jgi:ribosome maturation factor RimP
MGLVPIFCFWWRILQKITEILNDLIAPAVTALGFEFVGIDLYRQGRHSLLRVYIDKEGGVTLTDCERASRQISAILDVEDPIQGRYDLEVSSPGLDRPLFTVAQYRKFVGKPVKIRLRTPLDGRRNFSGVIEAVNDETVTLIGEGETWVLPFIEIEKARLMY